MAAVTSSPTISEMQPLELSRAGDRQLRARFGAGAQHPSGRARRCAAADVARLAGHVLRAPGRGACAGDVELLDRPGVGDRCLPRRGDHPHRHRASVHRESEAAGPGRRARAARDDRLPRGHPQATSGRSRRSGRWRDRSERRRATGPSAPTTRRSCSSRRDRRVRPRAWSSVTAISWPTATSLSSVIDISPKDVVFNALPVFHSFGLTGGLLMPLLAGRADVSLSVAAALSHRAGACVRHECDDPLRNRHVPCRLCSRRRQLRLLLGALRVCRRRAGEAGDTARVVREVRHSHSRRLRRDRDGAWRLR